MTTRGRKEGWPLPVGSRLIDAAMEKLGAPPEWKAIALWEEVCGPTIAARTEPERLVGKILYVRVPSSAWATDLTYVKADLITRLRSRARLPIEDLRFVVGDVRALKGAEARKAPAREPASSAPPKDAAAIEAAVAQIGDPELAAALRALGLRIVRDP
jgi:hypothetical protein